MSNSELEYPEIQQDHKRGPGWFLISTYIVVTMFCIYYFLTYRDWQSNYDKQQADLQAEISK
jgi:hypothetical protein